MEIDNLISECTAYDYKVMVNHFIHRDYTVMGGEVHLDIYDNRLAITSPGGMYNGKEVQNIPIDEISSDRRNPILADVMSQLDYMEKRGSGLKRICNETKKLESFKSDRMPVFKSTSSQFLTIIYSMEYGNRNTMDSLQVETKMGLSWEQVGTRLGLSWDEVEELFVTLQQPTTISDLKTLYGWSNSSKFKAKYVTPLIEAQLVCITHPDKPTSPNQRYLLTENGELLLANETKTTDAEENVNRLIGKLSEKERNIVLNLLQNGVDAE